MLLRVFAVTDESELGLACLEWMQFMLALDMPLRIASATGAAEIMGDRAGRSPNPWSRLSSYFATPLEDEYVNIVMTPPTEWARLWAKRARKNVAIVPVDFAEKHQHGELKSWSWFEDQLAPYDMVVSPFEEMLPAPRRVRDAERPEYDSNPYRSMRRWGSAIIMKPMAVELERFRAVIGG